jgi:hypothetical protein
MCCFSRPVELVSDTEIFARSADDRQFLVYSMSYAAATELAMVLPLPVPPNPSEDAVSFINLEGYPAFFSDMQKGFPLKRLKYRPGGAKSASLDGPKLRVQAVGDFEASFVPRIADFSRLDERFRIPADLWDRLPAYHDYGFAVFKLRASGAPSSGETNGSHKLRRVHPMAFVFTRRSPDLLYFPTVHVHDRDIHPKAMFDHMLYCQPDSVMNAYLTGWKKSTKPASTFMTIARTEGIVNPDACCWRKRLKGHLDNKDTMVGGSIPS